MISKARHMNQGTQKLRLKQSIFTQDSWRSTITKTSGKCHQLWRNIQIKNNMITRSSFKCISRPYIPTQSINTHACQVYNQGKCNFYKRPYDCSTASSELVGFGPQGLGSKRKVVLDKAGSESFIIVG